MSYPETGVTFGRDLKLKLSLPFSGVFSQY